MVLAHPMAAPVAQVWPQVHVRRTVVMGTEPGEEPGRGRRKPDRHLP